MFETKCGACHALDENRVGPHLAGVVGRRAGAVADFGYTPDLANANLTWNAEQLDEFLSGPAKKFPGTAMAFGGLRKTEDRQAVVCFLSQQK
ncbi:Cytochrome c2 [compost metagenome]